MITSTNMANDIFHDSIFLVIKYINDLQVFMKMEFFPNKFIFIMMKHLHKIMAGTFITSAMFQKQKLIFEI